MNLTFASMMFYEEAVAERSGMNFRLSVTAKNALTLSDHSTNDGLKSSNDAGGW